MLKKWLWLAMISLVLWSGASVAFAASMTVDGSLPRSYSTGSFEITVTVTRVSAEEVEAGAEDANAASRLGISIANDNDYLPFSFEEGAQGSPNRYYIEVLDEEGPEDDPDNVDQFMYTYQLRIHDNSGGTNLEEDASGDKLTVTVDFFLGGTETEPVASNDNNPKVLQRELYVITSAPSFDTIPVRGVYESLIVDYAPVTTVPASDGQQRAPTSIKVAVIDTGVVTGDTTFPAMQFVDDANSEDTATTCQYSAANIDGGACVTCEDNVYIDMTALSNLAGVKVVTGDATEGTVAIGGLENRSDGDPVYAVFMQYEPSGIDQSSCMVGRPTEDITLTELNGAGKAEILDFRCFIATAAYGSAFHQDLDLLPLELARCELHSHESLESGDGVLRKALPSRTTRRPLQIPTLVANAT